MLGSASALWKPPSSAPVVKDKLREVIEDLEAGVTADELDKWMDDRAEELSSQTLRLIHQILERAIRHAQARDKVRATWPVYLHRTP
jgi:hypothetical protein